MIAGRTPRRQASACARVIGQDRWQARARSRPCSSSSPSRIAPTPVTVCATVKYHTGCSPSSPNASSRSASAPGARSDTAASSRWLSAESDAGNGAGVWAVRRYRRGRLTRCAPSSAADQLTRDSGRSPSGSAHSRSLTLAVVVMISSRSDLTLHTDAAAVTRQTARSDGATIAYGRAADKGLAVSHHRATPSCPPCSRCRHPPDLQGYPSSRPRSM